MDPIALGILGVVAVALVYFFFFREEKDLPEVKPNYNPTLTPEQQQEAQDLIERAAEEFKAKLPPMKELEALTKAKLEDLGREHGIELDKRMTKANMIADLKKQHKAK